MTDSVLLQVVFLPAAAAVGMVLLGPRAGKAAGWVTALVLAYTTARLAHAGAALWGGAPPIREDYLVLSPEIRLAFLADGLSLPVAFIANVLCWVLSLFSQHYIAYRIEGIYGPLPPRERWRYTSRFYALFLLFPIGFAGVALATNLIAMYFFLELLTLALYFLMAYFGYIQRVRIAMMCLLWGIFSAVFFLAGSLLVYSQTGDFEIVRLGTVAGTPAAPWIIAVFLVGLFAKLAVFPFHVWMPWVHAEHPTCIAGLLAVYANIAAYIIVRALVLPLYVDFQPFGPPILVLALVTMVYGSLLTLAQSDIKRIAACSTISQIAYSLLGIGALTAVSLEGGMFFFLSHIMGKTVFFSTAGIVVYVTHVRDVRSLGGLAARMPLTALLFLSGAMMLSGFPPFSSFAAEWILFSGIFERAARDDLALAVGLIGVAAILLTVAYTFQAARRVFYGPLPAGLHAEAVQDPPRSMSIPLFCLVGLSIALGLYPEILMGLLRPVISGALPALP